MAKVKKIYVCRACGYESSKWMGQCPECHAWNTLEEREAAPAPAAGKRPVIPELEQREGCSRLKTYRFKRTIAFQPDWKNSTEYWAAVLSKIRSVLWPPRPGAGKSTLLLQTAQHIAEAGYRVLYISGEESESQLRRRAARILPNIQDQIWVYATAHMNEVLSAIDETDPALIILDSIQTFFLDEYTSRPGSPTQIVECTNAIMKVAKNPEKPRAVLMAGQLTKEDELAGVRALEHMVDTVLYMEADPAEELRSLSATKNRFGSNGRNGLFYHGGRRAPRDR